MIKLFNQKVQDLFTKLTGTLIIITADHGLLDIREYIALDDIQEINKCLAMPLSMEGRAMSFVVKHKKVFQERFHKLFGNNFL